jgi:ribonuclease P protein component
VQKKFRLTRSEDFKRVRRSGKSYAHPLVVLIVQAHDQRSPTNEAVLRTVPSAFPGTDRDLLGKSGRWGGSPVDQPRVKIGVAAGRAVGTAIRRNRAKRLLREAMRTLIPNITSGFDLVLIARPKLPSATLEETRQALLILLQRAQILTPMNES